MAVVFVAGKATEVIERDLDDAVRPINCCMKPLLGSTLTHCLHQALLKHSTGFQADLQQKLNVN